MDELPLLPLFADTSNRAASDPGAVHMQSHCLCAVVVAAAGVASHVYALTFPKTTLRFYCLCASASRTGGQAMASLCGGGGGTAPPERLCPCDGMHQRTERAVLRIIEQRGTMMAAQGIEHDRVWRARIATQYLPPMATLRRAAAAWHCLRP